MKTLLRAALALSIILLCSRTQGAQKVKSLCEIGYPSDAKIQWSCQKLKWTDTPGALFGERWQDVLRFNRMDRRHFIGGVSIKVPGNLEQVKNFTPLPLNYPQAAKEPKFILIDQSEMFLGAYQYGKMVFSLPIAVGEEKYRVPNGTFQIDAADLKHQSNLYTVEEIGRPYPMHYALRFFEDKSIDTWPSYWIHGRDLPGYPASHGCIGLYDEEMQYDYYDTYDRKVNKQYYHPLTQPYLQGAKLLYDWIVDPKSDPGTFHKIQNGPKVLFTGQPPQ